ncbi:hypothetical protein E1B28_012758 [Marasmius oreades]|uniref:Uncharacterized protein n=1 Tax=Marasmius oreades TaxID=181124 RepID=A0A9P7RSY6_9AGAR|nr:uncharacterized protein E1B28_012758 [Marasmius oreades]KAG7088795.1 hypothetical protein E1B28_012758 [Marasmius oreades]
MGRWTQYDEDEYRLPPGVRRTGYDADTGEYFFSGGYKSLPYSEYGPLIPVGTTHTKPKQATTIVSEFLSPKAERASTSRLRSATAVRGLWERYKHRERRDPVVSPTEEWESSSEEEEPSKDGKVTVTPPVTLTMLSKLHRDKPTPGGLEQTEPQFTLPIYDKFSSRSNSLSAVSRTGSNVSSSSSSRHTRSVTTPEVSRRVDGNRDGAEDKGGTRQYRSLGVTSTSPTRKALGSHESPPSHRESSSSSMNATIGSGSRIPSFITESDLPPPPLPAKDCHSRVTSLSSSDVRESWSTEGGSLSSLPYLGVSS